MKLRYNAQERKLIRECHQSGGHDWVYVGEAKGQTFYRCRHCPVTSP